MNKINNISDLIILLEQVALHPPSIKWFNSNLHENWNEDHTIREIVDSAEDLIVHAPGYWFRKGINMSKLKKDSNYRILLNDIMLLKELEQGIITKDQLKTKRYFLNRKK